MARRPFEARRGGPRLDTHLEARLRAIEQHLFERGSLDAADYDQADEMLGGGIESVQSSGGGGGGGGGPVTLAGDVTGPSGSTTVVAIQNVPVVAPVAGDDLQFAQYVNASGDIEWVAVPLTGDVSGNNTATSVDKIKGKAVDTPAAGDDQQFAQYDNGSGTIRWVPVTAALLTWPIVTKTADYTATVADAIVLIDTTGGAVTITLPAVATMTGRMLVMKKISTPDANTVTLDGNGAEQIDGALTYVFNVPYMSISLVCDGTAWWVI